MIRPILLLFSVYLFFLPLCAQEKLPITVADIPMACEQNAVYLTDFNVKRLAGGKTGFVIIRAGDGEGTKILNHRFNIVSKYLKKYLGESNLIFARGEAVSGEGRVELYIGGDLYLIMFARKGRVPCMNCCGYDFQRGRF